MGFVSARAHHPEFGETASFLLALANEMGFTPWDVKVANGGFEVPDEVADAVNGTVTPPSPTAASELGEPPAWWSEPIQEPDVDFQADGKVVLKETPAEFVVSDRDEVAEAIEEAPAPAKLSEVRAWAEENGIKVAPKGRIAQPVIDAYYAAQE